MHTRPVTPYTAHLHEADVRGPSTFQRFNLNLSLLSSLICPVAYPPLCVFPLLEDLADVPQGVSLKFPVPVPFAKPWVNRAH